MAIFDDICRMAADNADLANFVVIYIEEAHPTDGWAFPDNVLISQHQTLDDRLTAAARVQDTHSFPDNMTVVADTMSIELNLAYGGLYDRLYVIQSGIVAYQADDPLRHTQRLEPMLLIGAGINFYQTASDACIVVCHGASTARRRYAMHRIRCDRTSAMSQEF